MGRKRPKTEQLAEQVAERGERADEAASERDILLPSGSSLLNLACSDRISGAFKRGRTFNITGDSSAGKTAVALTILASIINHKDFAHYIPYYDDAESANDFDVSKMFGQKLADAVRAPNDDGSSSNTVEDWHCSMMDILDEGSPFVYVLDSLDSLTSEAELEKLDEFRDARKKGKEVAGSYAMSKQKKLSQAFSQVCQRIEESEALFIVIRQVRDNTDRKSPFEAKNKASGGRALKFYCSHEVWVARKGAIKKAVNGKPREIGIQIAVNIPKNKLTGKVRRCEFPFYYGYGLDDTRSCIDFLLENKVWSKSGQTINAKTLDISGKAKDLILEIEGDRKKHKEMKRAVRDAWRHVEEKLDEEFEGRAPRFE